MRTRLTAIRMPAYSYISMTAASAWLTIDAPAWAAGTSRFQTVTPLDAGQVGERVAVDASVRGKPDGVRGRLPLVCLDGAGPPEGMRSQTPWATAPLTAGWAGSC